MPLASLHSLLWCRDVGAGAACRALLSRFRSMRWLLLGLWLRFRAVVGVGGYKPVVGGVAPLGFGLPGVATGVWFRLVLVVFAYLLLQVINSFPAPAGPPHSLVLTGTQAREACGFANMESGGRWLILGPGLDTTPRRADVQGQMQGTKCSRAYGRISSRALGGTDSKEAV